MSNLKFPEQVEMMKLKIVPLLFLAAAVAAHEEESPPILQGFVHSLGIPEQAFVIGLTAVILVCYVLWKRV